MSNSSNPVNMVLLFADEDEAWRVDLLNHLNDLKNEGRIVLWDVHQVVPGTDRAEAIKQQLEAASIILLLTSAALLASHRREIEQVLHRQVVTEVLVIPILLHPVDWQGTPLAHLQPLPGNRQPITMWQSQDAAFVEVVAGIRKALPEVEHLATSIATRPSPLSPSIWNIPHLRNPFFTGRDELLTRLSTALKTDQATALSQPQAISGLGGIGKTQLAVEYAYRSRRDYQAVFWARAESVEALTSSYLAIATLLNLPERAETEQAVTIQAVKRWLQTHQGWLLILDNADELDLLTPFLPPIMGGHLLLTTRAGAPRRFGIAQPIELPEQMISPLTLDELLSQMRVHFQQQIQANRIEIGEEQKIFIE